MAAPYYHFGSKEVLPRSGTGRVVEPLNRRRLELLDGAIADAAPDGPSIEALVHRSRRATRLVPADVCPLEVRPVSLSTGEVRYVDEGSGRPQPAPAAQHLR